MYNFSKTQQFRWKGKLVSEKKYKAMLQRQLNGKARRKQVTENEEKNSQEKNGDEEEDEDFPVKGERIINLEFMAKNFKCISCNEPLLLVNIKKEIRRGCKSILHVECHSCLLLNNVSTGKQSIDDNQSSYFDLNYKIATGLMHSGITFQSFNKLCASLDIPSMSRNTFKHYEGKVGKVAEEVAQTVATEPQNVEKTLIAENIEEKV